MKNITFFFFAFFFLAFFNAANSQSGGQSPVSGLGYAPDSNYIIISKLYRGRNGVAVWMHKDSTNWLGGIEYNNHVFLSQNGNNNGKLGRFDKPFADPWAAQDSFPGETNLSFLAYQGNYSYTAPYDAANTQALTKTDTFRLIALPGANFEMLNATAQLRTFITDVSGSTTQERHIYIDAPESVFNFTDIQSLSFPISVYNKESSLIFRARKFTQTGGRMINSLGAAKYARVEIDSLYTSGGVALGVAHDFSTTGTDTTTRDIEISLGEVYCDGTTDVTAALRMQAGENTRGLVDTLSRITIKAKTLRTPLTGGVMIWYSDSSSFINSTAYIDVENYYSNAAAEYFVTSKTSRNGQKQSQFKNSQILVKSKNVNTGGKLIKLGWEDTVKDTLELSGNTVFEIDIQNATAQGSVPIYLSKVILKDNATLKINCDNCQFNTSPAIIIRRCNIPDGTKIVFSGLYQTSATGELVSIENNNTDLTGLTFENAVFLNNGVSEWIQASGATTINGASGLWSNSDSTINVTIQANKLWSFQYPGNANFYDLQTVIDSLYNAFSSGSDGNGIISALPAGNVAINAASHNFDITSAGNITQTGSGSATYRFNLYPSSSLPVLLEQTSAGDTAYLQLRANLGRATLRATQDIYLEAASSVFVSTLEGSSTGIVSARPTGELIRRERAFVNASINTDTFTVALSPTEINLPFNDDVSEGFNVSGDSLIYTGTDTAYFEIGYYQNIEFLESATGTYRLNLSVYQNGVNIPRSEMEHLIYFRNTTTEPILTAGKTFIVQLINGDVLNIRQNGTTGINAAIHNLSITANKIE